MPLKLYKMDLSAPACAAMMICEIHNVPVEMIDVKTLEKEQLKPEYIKKNPLHTVPMLEDGDLYIHDSHVILTYLTDKYGKDDSLYPKDLKKRALVDQKLYFDVLLFNRLWHVVYPAVFEGVRKPSEKVLNAVREVYDFLETFLNNTKFVAADNMTIADVSLAPTVGAAQYVIPIEDKNFETFLNNTKFVAADNMTIADVSLAPTVGAAQYVIPIDDKKYPKIKGWFSYMEKQPFYQKRTAAGSAKLKELLQQHLDL